MARIATGQKTILDLTDDRRLAITIASNLPKTQVRGAGLSGALTPDWSRTPLLLTPEIYANDEAMLLSDPALAISWLRRSGDGEAESLGPGEQAQGGRLRVDENTLSQVESGLITYCVRADYTDPITSATARVSADISFSQIQTAVQTPSAWISGEQAFKYTGDGAVHPERIELTAHLSQVAFSRWQYRSASGAWVNYPESADNPEGQAVLTVRPTDDVFVADVATLRVVTNDSAVTDILSLYKVRDGAAGGATPIAFLTNENITFAADAQGAVRATARQCQIVAYQGSTKVSPDIGTITGIPPGMQVTRGTLTDRELPLTLQVAEGATLGGSGPTQGSIDIPVIAPVSTTLHITWSKINTGADGEGAVVFSLYAPDGTVFDNGGGQRRITTAAYLNGVPIAEGASYVWERLEGGVWQTLAGETGDTLTVAGSSVEGVASFRCTMTFRGRRYTDAISLVDRADSFQAVIESTGGDIFRNNAGESFLIARLFQRGQEVDPLRSGVIGPNAPVDAVEGSYWYQLDRAARSVTLKRYQAGIWSAVEPAADYPYSWYRRDKQGHDLDPNGPYRTGKILFVDSEDVDVKTTFRVEVG